MAANYLTPLICMMLALPIVCHFAGEKQTGLVLIGVLLQPMQANMKDQYPFPDTNFQFVKGFFVDYVESSGASAVLLPFDLPLNTLTSILDGLQMVLFPGGDAELVDEDGEPTAYQLRQHFILEYAKKRYQAGKPLPVLGICLGFEAMLISGAGNNCSVLTGGFNDELNVHNMSLDFKAINQSFYWNQFDKKVINEVLAENYLLYMHDYGVTPDQFNRNLKLTSEYRITGTSKTDAGYEFVAGVEHVDYPFVGFQFHPESNAFRHLPQYSLLNRSTKSIEFMNGMMKTMVDSVRHQAKPYDQIPQLLISMTTTKTNSQILVYGGAERMYYEKRLSTDGKVKASHRRVSV